MTRLLTILIFLAVCVACPLRAAESIDAGLIKKVVKAADCEQGMGLVLGSAQDALAVVSASGMNVQACTGQAQSVAAGRDAIAQAGLSHRASVIWREANHLPYADGLANLLFVPDLSKEKMSAEEIQRVIAPGGAVAGKLDTLTATLTGKYGFEKLAVPGPGWSLLRKPVEPKLGTWTHVKGGEDQSYVNDDEVVAPWKEIRWIGDPQWGSLTGTYSGLVTAGGRIYYKEAHTIKAGKQYYLVCRDAFNGFEYWRVASGPVNEKYYSLDLTLCCDEQRVYLTEGKELVARDRNTGAVAYRYAVKYPPQSVTATAKCLLASTKSTCLALHKESGQMLFTHAARAHPASDGQCAYVFTGKAMVALDLATGKPRWSTPCANVVTTGAPVYTVSCKAGGVYLVHHEKWKPKGGVKAFDAKTGALRWERDGRWSHGVLPFGKEVWLMNRDNKHKTESMRAIVVDAESGKELSDSRIKGGVMSKCWGVRGTPNYMLYSNGWFLDRKTAEGVANKNTRSPCQLGQHPANGLTYFMPHHCDCKVTLRGFLALSKPGERAWFDPAQPEGAPRLFPMGGAAPSAQDQSSDWPMYRRDTIRSNATPDVLPAQPKILWSAKLGEGELTQTTFAYGTAFVADRRGQRVFALDPATGKVRWSFNADGSIEAAPSLAQGYCLFSTGAGTVYALNAQTGKEIWHLRAAPVQKRIADRGKFESPWPVRGGVFIHEGVGYFSVGRSGGQSGGLWLNAVDIRTGQLKWRHKLGGSGDMCLLNGPNLSFLGLPYKLSNGERIGGAVKKMNMLFTTRYLTTVSLIDYFSCMEPNKIDKRHIELSNGTLKGDLLSWNSEVSIAAGRYSTGVDGWKTKHGQYFIRAKGSATWNWDALSQQLMGMVLSKQALYAVGRPASVDPDVPCEFWVHGLKDGKKTHKLAIDGEPVYDGLSAAGGKLFLSTMQGTVYCLGE